MRLGYHLCLSIAAILVFTTTARLNAAISDPADVATVIIDGIDSDGAATSGVVGRDRGHQLIDELALLMNIPTGMQNPRARNQITMTRHYGDSYPGYYSNSDRANVDQLTNQYGGGVPRYAAIVAKFARQVMARSGARQVNIIGLSFGALIGRWMIENDYEGLASQGRIARFITVEGVVAGNWIASEGGPLLDLVEDNYDKPVIDFQHMTYDWIEDNLNAPHFAMDNPLYRNIQVSHWASTNDDKYERALTLATLEPSDGIQLYRDTFFRQLSADTLYNNQIPTLGHAYATHDTVRDHDGIRAGLIADLTSTRRVRITLLNARVKQMPESGEGEVVFGARIKSPLALSRYGFTNPINQVDNLGHTILPSEMDEDEQKTLNQVIFDDFVLPGEASLTIDFDVREIDFDVVYEILEDPFSSPIDNLGSNDVIVSTLASGNYVHNNEDWTGNVRVDVIDYPAFVPRTAVVKWLGYR